jgi:hypothetical protein
MNNYSIALYLHIIGTLGFFVALGLEWTGISQIRSAMTLEQVRAWMGILKNVRKVGFVSMLTTVVTGIYMMVAGWGGQAWILVTVGAAKSSAWILSRTAWISARTSATCLKLPVSTST